MQNHATVIQSDVVRNDSATPTGDFGEDDRAGEVARENRSMYLNALLALLEPPAGRERLYAHPESDLLR
jgi:hypothetical protein